LYGVPLQIIADHSVTAGADFRSLGRGLGSHYYSTNIFWLLVASATARCKVVFLCKMDRPRKCKTQERDEDSLDSGTAIADEAGEKRKRQEAKRNLYVCLFFVGFFLPHVKSSALVS
jgi:hypothetical protein